MIIIRVELHSAVTGKITEIARMGIANIGGSTISGDYRVETYRGRCAADLWQRKVQRHSEVRGYPRRSVHVWHLVARALVARALVAMGYAGKRELAQPGDVDEASP